MDLLTTICCNNCHYYLYNTIFSSRADAIRKKVIDIASDNKDMCLTNKKLKELFKTNQSQAAHGRCFTFAHICCCITNGSMNNPDHLGQSISNPANLWIFREDNNVQHQQQSTTSKFFSISISNNPRNQHIWYIYPSSTDLSINAIRALIETERELNAGVLTVWNVFVDQKIKTIRKELGFIFAVKWLNCYKRRFGGSFTSLWELWNHS